MSIDKHHYPFRASLWIRTGFRLTLKGASLQTYQVKSCFEALVEGVLMAPLDSRYTQIRFNLISVQVWACIFWPSKPSCSKDVFGAWTFSLTPKTYMFILPCLLYSKVASIMPGMQGKEPPLSQNLCLALWGSANQFRITPFNQKYN